MHDKQVIALVAKSTEFANQNGEKLSSDLEAQAHLLIRWIYFLANYKATNVANELLEGAMCAIRETAACLSLGLVRPALFSLRAQIDLILTWIYFKDHPMEWQHVNLTGEGFKLKTEILKYLNEMYPKFQSRFGILKETRIRKEEDPYKLLSAHIHAQSTAAMPNVVDLADAVSSLETGNECVKIEFEVSEFLSDILSSIFLEDHLKFDKEIISSITSRMKTHKQKLTLFGGT
ncbi:hypothetical protein SCB29_21430 [Paraburkholderia sp. SIMBA_055]